MANYLRDAIRYQQEMEEANRPVTVNSLMARKAAAIKQNAPAENMLTQYAQTMPQNWQQFGQNLAQAYPTPATGASRDQILSAVTQAAMNVGPLMTVYHGSPHRFDKFDASKIGTGEGAQAYGHGLYFAEKPEVASSYMAGKSGFVAEPMISGKPINQLPKDLLHQWEMRSNGTSYGMLDELRKVSDPAETLAYYKRGGGPLAEIAKEVESMGIKNAPANNLYKVDLPDDHIAKMLDWDKPLSQQSAAVQTMFKDKLASSVDKVADDGSGYVFRARVGNSFGYGKTEKEALSKVVPSDIKGSDLYQLLGDQAQSSAMLKQAGIPGIRYLDQGSRAAPSSAQFAKTDVVGAADDLTALAKSMGLNAEVRHSGSNAGKSSYVSVFDPMTNRYIKSSFRISDHGTGPLRHQEHIHINSPADLATQKNDLFEWVKRNRTEKGVDTTGLSAPSQGTSNFVVFDPKHMNIIGRE